MDPDRAAAAAAAAVQAAGCMNIRSDTHVCCLILEYQRPRTRRSERGEQEEERASGKGRRGEEVVVRNIYIKGKEEEEREEGNGKAHDEKEDGTS